MKRPNNSVLTDGSAYKKQKTEKKESNIKQEPEILKTKFLSLKSKLQEDGENYDEFRRENYDAYQRDFLSLSSKLQEGGVNYDAFQRESYDAFQRDFVSLNSKLQEDGENYDEFQSSFVTSIARKPYAATFIASLLKENYLVLKNIITLCKKSENLSITFFSSILNGTDKESAKVIEEVSSVFFKKEDENFSKDKEGNFIPSDTYKALQQVDLVKSFLSILNGTGEESAKVIEEVSSVFFKKEDENFSKDKEDNFITSDTYKALQQVDLVKTFLSMLSVSGTGKESAKVIKEAIDKIFVTKNSDPVAGEDGQYQLLNSDSIEPPVAQRNDNVEANESMMLSDTEAASDTEVDSIFFKKEGKNFLKGEGDNFITSDAYKALQQVDLAKTFLSILNGTGEESAKVIEEVASIFFKKEGKNFSKDKEGNFIPSDTYKALQQVDLVKSFLNILNGTGEESAKVIKEAIDKIFVTKNSDPVVGEDGQYQLLGGHQNENEHDFDLSF